MRKLVKKPISQLEGPQLDWAVAKVCGIDGAEIIKDQGTYWCFIPWPYFPGQKDYSPSTEWQTGGPIIERERINISNRLGLDPERFWFAHVREFQAYGQTPLIAAMRTVVHAAHDGSEIEVPACES